MSIQNENDPI